MSKEENPRVSFRLAGEKHKRLKRIAVDCDTTLEKLLNTATNNWLHDYENAIHREPVDLQPELDVKSNTPALPTLDTEAITLEVVAVLATKGLTNGSADVIAGYVWQAIDAHVNARNK